MQMRAGGHTENVLRRRIFVDVRAILLHRYAMKWLAGLALLLCVVSRAGALTIVNYDPTVNNRFTSGFPSGTPTPNTSAQFVGNGQNLSGVGWNPADSSQNFAMISSQYFVYATHNGHGTNIDFYSPTTNGVVSLAIDTSFSYTPILNSTGQSGDLSIGRLVSPISPTLGITSYPILNLATTSSYFGLPLLVYGDGNVGASSPRLGTNNLDSIGPQDINNDTINDTQEFTYSYDTNKPGEAGLEGGDSGAPTFSLWNGQLALLGIHSAIDNATPYNSYDAFIPYYLDQMSANGISFTAVPEPGRAGLMGLALTVGLLWRRRNHTRI
jgi:hypothetical protein